MGDYGPSNVVIRRDRGPGLELEIDASRTGILAPERQHLPKHLPQPLDVLFRNVEQCLDLRVIQLQVVQQPRVQQPRVQRHRAPSATESGRATDRSGVSLVAVQV